VARNPDIIRPPRPTWIFGHDCQIYTYQEFDTVAEAIRAGEEYTPHNVPYHGKYIMKVEYKGASNDIGES
jgi:hypothetical protein